MNSIVNQLSTQGLHAGYDKRTILDNVSLEIPPGSFTVIVGANASGKSTLLRSMARLLPAQSGRVLLDGADISSMRTKELARRIGLLPQSAVAPESITVIDLVSRGRHPHQGIFRQWTQTDEAAVQQALADTRLTALATSAVDQLSGGQRQRVWIAMVLAQDTPLMLLDEPTTFLDLAHQIEVLELCTTLNKTGHTLVAVLHDLNQAARYGTHLVAIKDGTILAQGPPAETVTAELIEATFGVRSRIVEDPESGTPLIIPLAHGAVQG
ncbi:MAG: ABC transporter ATP-binding protein [Yaniella sp.]|uniref:ABC transporter ATP-binding protein n=1 Tax=Yaniella sp. TaxID=2773929 RepID=UPI00264761AF|nr:ABC transporter ATP-binding protein [Yaniella sp.]MDN5730665.1 ABC transporter ATP-binding protein [Yaniella sp.]MDN5742230.1 ABC transporter ATP-binding protein [Yaniella sp.]MDN5815856.1 ABC transporter ATP-binding protein [Yaniella sp.]MDN5817654.1 ABC transporter ATP-binding protein [Yaniella sp.]MDN5837189.1 ABC transporter ATP-binding protein [Yaniella sp.]